MSMQSERLAVLRGALISVSGLTGESGRAARLSAGISDVEWSTLRQTDYWNASDLSVARVALEEALAAGFMLAGLPRLSIVAEVLAATIALLVAPANWMSACYVTSAGVDGTRLVAPDGDEEPSREYVSTDRLFAMVLLAANQKSEVVRGDDVIFGIEEEEA